MTTVKEFKPVLMYVDHERIEVLMKSAKESAVRINNGLSEIQESLEVTFGDQEKIELLEKGFPYLHQKIKEQFQFPKATDEFNLQSMGKVEEFNKSKLQLSQICAAFRSANFNLMDGSVVLSDEGKTAITDANTHYTKNQAQTDALNLAEKLVKNLNKAKDKGWISNYDIEQVKRGITITNFDSGKFIPDYQNISYLNSEGQLLAGY